MLFRQLANRILPNLEKDLSRSLSKEVATMDEFMFMAGRVYSYQTTTASASPSVFGSTSIRQAPASASAAETSGSKLVRVDKPVLGNGLFHD